MKNPNLLTSLYPLALIAGLTLSAGTWATAQASSKESPKESPDRDFLWYCQSGEATPAQQHTVRVLFDLADMDYDVALCEEAFDTLSYRSYVALPDRELTDLAPLSGFERVNFIDAPGNKIASLKGLVNLPSLKKLWLPDNEFKSFPNIAKFPKLNNLVLHNNPIESLANVLKHPSLQTLRMNGTQIRDYSPLAKLNISWLELGNTKYTDALSTLPQLPNVRVANLSGNGLTDFSRFKAFPKVGTIVARQNNIASIKGLESFDPIPTTIDLADNMLERIDSPKVLQSLGSIDFSHNPIKDYSFLTELKDDILSLKLDGTTFNDWSLIARFMSSIYNLSLRDTPVAAITLKGNSASRTEEWHNIHRLDLRDTGITSFTPFKAISAPKLRRFDGPTLEGATEATCPTAGVPDVVGYYCQDQIGRSL